MGKIDQYTIWGKTIEKILDNLHINAYNEGIDKKSFNQTFVSTQFRSVRHGGK